MFYLWQTMELFDQWHKNVNAFLKFPTPGRNAATGEIDVTAQWTTAYTHSIINQNGTVLAFVEDHIAEQFSENLGVPAAQPEISSG